MKSFARIGIAAGVLLVGGAFVALAGDAPKMEPDQLLEALKAKQDKVLVLDVRSEEEYQGGHVPGAVNIPYDQLPGRVDEVKSQQADRIVVYCESGRRAGKAEATLQEAGFENVYDLDGHMRGWREQKRPTRRPMDTPAPKSGEKSETK